MRIIEIKIKIAEKEVAKDLPESAIDWDASLAVIDLDQVTCMYDVKEDGIKICGRDFELIAENYTLKELTELWLGLKPLPKWNLSIPLNSDGTCDEKTEVCVLCGK